MISVETMAPCNRRDTEAGGLSVSKMDNKKRKYSPIVWDRDDKVVFRFLQVFVNQGHRLNLLYWEFVVRMEYLVPLLRDSMVDITKWSMRIVRNCMTLDLVDG